MTNARKQFYVVIVWLGVVLGWKHGIARYKLVTWPQVSLVLSQCLVLFVAI